MTLNITLMIYIPEGNALEKAEIIPARHYRRAGVLEMENDQTALSR